MYFFFFKTFISAGTLLNLRWLWVIKLKSVLFLLRCLFTFFLSRSTRFLVFFFFLQFYFSTLEWKYAIGALFFSISYFIKKKSTVGWNKMRLESEFSFCYFSIFISPFSSSIRDAKAELYEMNIKHGYCQEILDTLSASFLHLLPRPYLPQSFLLTLPLLSWVFYLEQE